MLSKRSERGDGERVHGVVGGGGIVSMGVGTRGGGEPRQDEPTRRVARKEGQSLAFQAAGHCSQGVFDLTL